MATLRNKRKMAAVARESQEEQPRNSQSRSTPGPQINEDYIAQMSVEMDGRMTKKLLQEFSWRESRILGALFNLDKFLLNPQVLAQSSTILGTSRNSDTENQEPSEDRFRNDPLPEVGTSI